MTFPRPIRLLFLAAALLAFASSTSAAIPGPYSSGTCTAYAPLPPSGLLNYTLALPFPTTGYTLTLVNVSHNKNPVEIRVHYTLARGAHGDIVVTHTVNFTQIASRAPTTYIVYANGVKLGPAKRIWFAPVTDPLPILVPAATAR
jgi:hypothetical protein